MTNHLIVVKAIVRFKKAEQGGRHTPVYSGYRPQHSFVKPDKMETLQFYIGDIRFNDQEYISLGETKEVTVRFLRNPMIEKFISVGQQWFMYEGVRLVGEGEIIEI